MFAKTIILCGALLTTMSLQAVEPRDSTTMSGSIEQVVVTGTRALSDVRLLPFNVSVVDRQTLSLNSSSSVLPSVVEHVPGIFVSSRGSMGYGVSTGAAGGIKIRGIGGNPTTGVLVLIDGQPQYMGLMGHSIADMQQSMTAERVEVVRGAASALYGSNAMGGVVNIITRKSERDTSLNNLKLSYGSFNTLNSEFTNIVRSKAFSSTVAVSYNRTDSHRKDMGFEQYGGYAKFGYSFDEHWSANLSGDVTHFNASNPGTVTAHINDNDSRITRAATILSIDNDYEHTSGALRLYYNYGRHIINDGFADGAMPLPYRYHSTDYMTGATLFQNVSFYKGNRVTFGVDYTHLGGHAWNRYVTNDSIAEISRKSVNEVAAYIDFRQQIGRRVNIDATLRADYHSVSGLEWVPQVGISVMVLPKAEFKATAGKGFRNPTLKELYMFRSQNDELRAERLWNYEVSFGQRIGSVSYDVCLFYINGDNMIETVVTDGRPKNINTGRIENFGTELSVAWHINPHWQVDANYSYLNMRYAVVAAPEHKLNIGGAFNHGRWHASTRLQYINGLYTNVKQNTRENFVLWNMRLGVDIGRRVELFAEVENILAQRYSIIEGYPMPKATAYGGINLKF